MNLFTQMFWGFVSDCCTDVCDKLLYYIAEWNSWVIIVNQTEEVARVVLFTTALGIALVSFMVVKQVISTYGFGTKGDPDQDAMEIVYRLCLMLGAMGMNTWLFTELTGFVTLVASDLSSVIAGTSDGITVVDIISTFTQNGETANIVDCSMSGVLIGGMVLFSFSGILRGAEITLSKILLPIFALDIINTNSEKWNMFIFQYGINFLSYLVQMLCYQLFSYRVMNYGLSDMNNILICIGWLVFSLKTPKWLEKYIYASNVGQTVGRGASRVGQVLMYAVRR